MFCKEKEVKMIAHRGYSGVMTENTLPAFEAAGERDYYGIETDVHVTKDGKFIIVHDDNLKRIADLDIVVEETTFEELRAVRFSDLHGATEEKNLYLPTLEEYIDVCKRYNKQAILELKNTLTRELVWEIAARIENMAWLEKTTFISFSRNNLLWLRERYADAEAQYLTGECSDADVAFMIENRFGGDICYVALQERYVEALHAAGLEVNVWTVDRTEDAKRMRGLGVDYITTNILE